ncbi:MAG: DUF4336 domain-containing protein [Acidobacteria bacterium]|nr:DUF4336 domain-containing protein [Acidobacteriota bacterium]
MKAVCDGVWVQDAEVKLPGGAVLPIRATVVQLDDGSLWVHSPVHPSPEWVRDLKAIGDVRHIVAPNTYHHLFIKKLAVEFGGACLYAPKALMSKRSDINWTTELQRDLWPKDFTVVPLEGMDKLAEFVFLHKKSATLIVTDLLFHIQQPLNWQARFLNWLANSAPGPRISRLLGFVTTDKARFVSSAWEISQLPFDRMVMAHGDVIETGGQAALSAALEHRYGKGAG